MTSRIEQGTLCTKAWTAIPRRSTETENDLVDHNLHNTLAGPNSSPGSLFSASLSRWKSRDHLSIQNRRVGEYSSTLGREENPVTPPFQHIFPPPRFWVVTWRAATRVSVPTTKGGREERPWERGCCRPRGVVVVVTTSLVVSRERQFVFWIYLRNPCLFPAKSGLCSKLALTDRLGESYWFFSSFFQCKNANSQRLRRMRETKLPPLLKMGKYIFSFNRIHLYFIGNIPYFQEKS